MFGRKKPPPGTNIPKSTSEPEDDIPPMPAQLAPLKPATPPRPVSSPAASQGSAMPSPDLPTASTPPLRPGAPPPGSPIGRPVTAPAVSSPPKSSASDRTLTVGSGISLTGEINACDRLVVEGKVEAALSDCKSIEIAESGLFKGSAEIQDADISGRFEGKLTVRGRLMIRSKGKVSGEVRYGQLEIELGGQIVGHIEATSGESARHVDAAAD
jgi:cytoskeletal protein CcmA (bactofilin family)